MTRFLYILNIFYLISYFCQFSVLCLFEMCNHKVELKAKEKLFVNSPYYPAKYPVGSSCRYFIKAPQDYQLKFTCNIKLNTSQPHSSTNCLNEAFYFNRDGSEILTESEFFCGTGNMERKSFLNQAVISYVSTPNYKRLLTSFTSIKDPEENLQKNKTRKIETTTRKQPYKITTTAKTATTFKALKANQLTTSAILNNLLTTSFTQQFSSTTSLPTISLSKEEHVSLKTNDDMNEEKKVSNSFAYVVAFLSNKIDREAFAAKTKPTTTTRTTKITSRKCRTSRPTSVLNFYGFFPANTWPNGSIATHKVSTKRVVVENEKVIANQDYASLQSAISFNSSNSLTHFIPGTRAIEMGGGLFSCLVEVIQPQCDCGWSSTAKIAGASGVAGINEFPAMAGIMTIKNQKIFCGATIIHRRYLLSAAHCFITSETNTAEYLTAVVGEHDLSTVLDSLYTRQYDLVKIIKHDYFKGTSNDIALLKTRFPIEWNRSVGPACLPFYALRYGSGTTPHMGQRVETAGWGTTSFGGQQSSLLLKATLDVMSNMECQKIIKKLPLGAFCTFTPGRDTCQYDSGGALYARGERFYAVGIVSYGYACATNQPSVNTRVAAYLKWIINKTPDAKYCTK